MSGGGAAFGLGPFGLPVGVDLLGGCDDCGAFHRLERDDLGLYHLRIYHDDMCPAYRAMRRRTAGDAGGAP